MFSRILVPLDATAYAEEILRPVRGLAATNGSHILLMRSVAPVASTDAEADAMNQADVRLHELVDDLRSRGLDADMVVCAGNLVDGIMMAMDGESADLIALRPERNWQASAPRGNATLLHLFERTALPVLVWNAAVEESDAMPDDPPHIWPLLERNASVILVPLDGSTLAERALSLAQALAHTHGAQLLLVRAVASATELISSLVPIPTPTELLSETSADRLTVAYLQRVEQATTYLKRLQHELERHGIRAQARVSTGTPLAAIQAAVARSRPQLIVMASHGYGSYGVRYLNSIAVRVIEHVEVPVMVIPSGSVAKVSHRLGMLSPSLEHALGTS